MSRYSYTAHLDWGPPLWLDYDGPLVDLAMAEARRRCIRPENLRWVQRQTHELVYAQENAAT